ncbi:unnamed protein product, partial [Symbiodinium microadriaticum]
MADITEDEAVLHLKKALGELEPGELAPAPLPSKAPKGAPAPCGSMIRPPMQPGTGITAMPAGPGQLVRPPGPPGPLTGVPPVVPPAVPPVVPPVVPLGAPATGPAGLPFPKEGAPLPMPP